MVKKGTKTVFWTDRDKEIAIELYNYCTYEEIGNILNRTKKSIAFFFKNNNLTINKEYSDEEKEFILQNHKNMTLKEMSEKLDRSIGGLRVFCNRNKIKCKRKEKVNRTYIGQKNNQLTVISDPYLKREKWGQNINYIKAECDCKENDKNIIEVREYYFLKGMVKSCGCLHTEKMRTCHGTGQNNAKWESPNEISQEFYAASQKRAAKKGLDWKVDINYLYDKWIEQDGFCNLSNVKLSLYKARQFFGRTYQSASVDRIDSSKGYIEGNIQWTHKILNLMKWDFTMMDFLNYCQLVTNFKNDNNSYEFEYMRQNRKHTWKGEGLIEGGYMSDLKKQAERRNKRKRKALIPFEITVNDAWLQFIWQHGRCALTGQVLTPIKRTVKNGKRYRTGNASIDRIDSNLGYIPSNIQWVHKDINLMKRDISNQDFKIWCALVNHYQINKSYYKYSTLKKAE